MRRAAAILMTLIVLALSPAPALGAAGRDRAAPTRSVRPPSGQVVGTARNSGHPMWPIALLFAAAIGIALLPPGRRVRPTRRRESDPWARALQRGANR